MKNMLVVDKEERNIVKMKVFSRKYGLELYEAHNALEASNQLKNNDLIDLVLIDINLDNEDGFELIEKIRSNYSALPIVILTTLNSKQDFIHGLKVGASDYLLKPFNEEIFVKRILNPSQLRVSAPIQQIDTVDIKTLIHAETVKARKGKYDISFGVAQYFNKTSENSLHVEIEYQTVSEKFFPGLKGIFFETDFILRYGSQIFIFVLPFCPKSEVLVVKTKLHDFSTNFMKFHQLTNYKLISTFSTYPDDDDIDFEIIDRLVDNINKMKQKELLS